MVRVSELHRIPGSTRLTYVQRAQRIVDSYAWEREVRKRGRHAEQQGETFVSKGRRVSTHNKVTMRVPLPYNLSFTLLRFRVRNKLDPRESRESYLPIFYKEYCHSAAGTRRKYCLSLQSSILHKVIRLSAERSNPKAKIRFFAGPRLSASYPYATKGM